MKANELMIGDLVTFKDCQNDKEVIVVKIWGINQEGNALVLIDDSDSLDEVTIDEEFVGIPLTPEIIEKNGMKPFDVDKLTDNATAKWWHKDGIFFIKQYHFKHHNFKPTYSFGCHNHTLIEGIEYVHELQHALKLCKIEKEISL